MTRQLAALLASAWLLASLPVFQGQDPNSALAGWVGTYKGNCVQMAYRPSATDSLTCTETPIVYPYYVTIKKGSSGYELTTSNFQTQITVNTTIHPQATGGVPGEGTVMYTNVGQSLKWTGVAVSSSLTPTGPFCITANLNGNADNQVAFTANVTSDDSEVPMYLETGSRQVLDNTGLLICPSSLAQNLTCDSSSYTYRCRCYKWD